MSTRLERENRKNQNLRRWRAQAARVRTLEAGEVAVERRIEDVVEHRAAVCARGAQQE
jgi:hypothetical protein